MKKKLVEMLHLELEPVGIFFGNTTAECELKADPTKRNCVIPFVIAAAEQLDKEEPFAIMGLFDISQRSAALKDYLSMTLTYEMWEEMLKGLNKSCLTTHSWRNIEKRLYTS